jgi:alpha-mannosidase
MIFLSVFLWHFLTTAQSIKRIYIANDDHTDYMWTANEVQYDSAFVKMLDYYLDQVDSTKNSSPNFQARFNCDGNYLLRADEKFRAPAQFHRLINSIRTGHISSPLNFLVSTYGAQQQKRLYVVCIRQVSWKENTTSVLLLLFAWKIKPYSRIKFAVGSLWRKI